MDDGLRRRLFEELHAAEVESDVSVVVIRGAGSCFSAGYDVSAGRHAVERTARRNEGWWSRLVVANWEEISALQIILVAQVHGACLGGGSELAAACDLAYVANDAEIGYPPTRLIASPAMTWQPWLLGWRHGMEAVLTGESMSGAQAAEWGFANRAMPEAELDETVLAVARRLAAVPHGLLAHNKRVMQRFLDASGVRSALRWAADMQPVAFGLDQARAYTDRLREGGADSVIDELKER
jgi:enoyl-CoA hydratase